MKLTVATWNMDHWKRTPVQRKAAWARLLESDVDVALLQEAVPPATVSRQQIVWREIGRERRFGSAVVTREWPLLEISTAKSCYSYISFPLLTTFPGSIAVARIQPPGLKPITFVSVYTVIDVYSTTTLLRQIADLTPLFDSVNGARVILGGDLNITLQSRDDQSELRRTRAAFVALESLGLVDLFAKTNVANRPARLTDCPCGQDDCYHLGTHRNASRQGMPGLHLDYLFASEGLVSSCQKIRVDEAAFDVSDHCPVIAEFDINDEAPQESAWDDQYAQDVSDTIKAILKERREWACFTPRDSRVVVRTDRALTSWIAGFSDGVLTDGRECQLEFGVWRESAETVVAYAGLLAKPIGNKLPGIVLAAKDPARVVSREHADYVVVPLQTSEIPEHELRAVLGAFVEGVSVASTMAS